MFHVGYFDFYVGYIFLFLFLLTYIFFYRTIHINRIFLLILGAFYLLSLVNVYQGNNSFPSLIKVLIGFILNGIIYYLLIRLNDYKVEGLFRIYLQFACIFALIGIFQEISFLAGFKNGYNFAYLVPRTAKPNFQSGMLCVSSLMQEPAHFGATMIPAFFISVLNILQLKKNFMSMLPSIFIIASVILTFSIVAYIGIIVVFLLIMLNYRRVKILTVGIILLSIAAFSIYVFLPVIRWKINDTIAVIYGKKRLSSANLSTWSFGSNGFIAYKSFMRQPLFGSGLGSHRTSYDRYIAQIIDPDYNKYPLNRTDASGLFFRLMSETGLLGLFLFFYFIFKFHVSRRKDGYLWIFSNAILCLFIVNLLRQGNYFYNGFILFIWLYYFSYKNAQNKSKVV